MITGRKRKVPIPPDIGTLAEKTLVPAPIPDQLLPPPVEVSDAPRPPPPTTTKQPKRFLGTIHPAVANEMLVSVVAAADCTGGLSCYPKEIREEKKANLTQVIKNNRDLLDELQPQNPIEGMIISRMVACHSLGLEMLSRHDNVEVCGSYGIKLCRLANECADLLVKLRRTGEQKIIVQHVNVEDGGRAIVGNVLPAGVDEKNTEEGHGKSFLSGQA